MTLESKKEKLGPYTKKLIDFTEIYLSKETFDDFKNWSIDNINEDDLRQIYNSWREELDFDLGI